MSRIDGRIYYVLWIVFIALVLVWTAGLIASVTLGGFIHLLLVIALTVLLAQLLNTRRVI